MSVRQDDERKIGFMKETSEIFIFTNQELTLLRQILSLTFHSEVGREIILRRFGEEYLRMGERLLVQLGGKESQRSFPHGGEMIEPETDASSSTEERRSQARESCTVLTDYTVKRQRYKGFIINMSHGGALLATSRRFLVGEEVALAFPHPVTKEHCRVTGEIVWEGSQGIGVRFQPTERGWRGVDIYASETHGDQSIQVHEEVKGMGRVNKKRVSWELAPSPDVQTYRLYWSKDREVNYDSDHEDIGRVPEIILPDDIPSFPLKTGKMELGVSAINRAGNESDIARITINFNFEVPEKPQNLKVVDL